MKISAIKKICKGHGKVMILTGKDNSQWVGVPGAMFAVDRGLLLTTENVPGLFDFSKREKRNIKVIHNEAEDERFRQSPMPGEAEHCKQYPVVIEIMGVSYMILHTEAGLLVLETDIVKPVIAKDGLLAFFVREQREGELLLAVYRDMAEVIALLKPVDASMADYLLTMAKKVVGLAAVRETGEEPVENAGKPAEMEIEDLISEVSALWQRDKKENAGKDGEDKPDDQDDEDGEVDA